MTRLLTLSMALGLVAVAGCSGEAQPPASATLQEGESPRLAAHKLRSLLFYFDTEEYLKERGSPHHTDGVYRAMQAASSTGTCIGLLTLPPHPEFDPNTGDFEAKSDTFYNWWQPSPPTDPPTGILAWINCVDPENTVVVTFPRRSLPSVPRLLKLTQWIAGKGSFDPGFYQWLLGRIPPIEHGPPPPPPPWGEGQ